MATRVVRSAGIGALAARAALAWIRRDPRAGQLHRTNFHGRTVTLAGGPALAAGATLGAVAGAPSVAVAAAALTAGTTAGVVGFYDDVVGNRPEQKAAKGFRGHLAALRAGRVTSGLVKVGGVGAAGLAAAALLAADRGVRSRRRGGAVRATADVLLGAGVIAGTANLVNLLDLRPGRAGKVFILLGAGLAIVSGDLDPLWTLGLFIGPILVLLPVDLREVGMLGDTGSNVIGAVAGVWLLTTLGGTGRLVALAVVAALTLYGELRSISRAVESVPPLRWLDSLGRA